MSIKMAALDALKTKFEGIDEKVLSRIAQKIAKTAKDDEEAKTQVEDMTLQGVIDAYTDSRVTEGSEKAVKTYEEKHGLKDGKRVVTKGGSSGDDDGDDDDDKQNQRKGSDDVPAWAKAMMDDLATLKGEKVASTRKSALDKALEGADEKMKARVTREFGRASFKDDEDFEGWIKEVEKDVKDAEEDGRASGGAGSKPKGGGTGDVPQVNAAVQARIDARKAETVTPAIQGLPTNNK